MKYIRNENKKLTKQWNTKEESYRFNHAKMLNAFKKLSAKN